MNGGVGCWYLGVVSGSCGRLSVGSCATCLWLLSRRGADIMDQVMQFVEPSRQFVKDSIRLVKRCTKPDRKVVAEYLFRKEVFILGIGEQVRI
ncbi:protein transport protein Sec61 subunit gamma isoform X2 [Bos indicus x Bos taurus]|uniref:protein transport protein Sec61 subunit gamma isoform X2 n=1 Tax=Bos indicus x Bos taurus TaxID=30522 RepID=UPI000F7D157C|nr:protein transport protein Sec61 subunit gamma isoform X2 [Bos indicus x Bos taurus]